MSAHIEMTALLMCLFVRGAKIVTIERANHKGWQREPDRRAA
jgi:hypothetical protein